MSEIANLDESLAKEYLKKDKEYQITYNVKIDNYRNITLTTKLNLITPGMKHILKNPYEVKVERSIVIPKVTSNNESVENNETG